MTTADMITTAKAWIDQFFSDDDMTRAGVRALFDGKLIDEENPVPADVAEYCTDRIMTDYQAVRLGLMPHW